MWYYKKIAEDVEGISIEYPIVEVSILSIMISKV